MKIPSMRLGILFLTTALTLAVSPGLFVPSYAAEGDTLRTILCSSGIVGVAFDGQFIYVPNFGSTITKCDPNIVAPASAIVDVIPITGTTDTIDSMSYDRTRDLFWGATSDQGANSINIYQITKAGVATFMFSVTADGASFTDGIAYDGEDDSFWISGDVAPNIWHYDTDGTLIAGPIPIPVGPGNFCGNSGIAAGTGILYLAFNGCADIEKHSKADLSFISSFDLAIGRAEDLECDDVTFSGVDAIWTKDAFDVDVVAFEVPEGTCPLGGVEEPPTTVGGEIMPISMTSLFTAGLFTSTVAWALPAVAAGIGASIAAIIRMRRRKVKASGV